MKKYFKLKAMRSIAGIIAIAAIFAFSMAACDNGTTGGGPGGNNNPGNNPGGYAPSAPTGLTATAVSTSRIDLRWNAVSGATGYYVYQSQSYNGTYNRMPTSPTDNSASNINLPANTTLYYRVTAYNSYGESGFSNIAYATTFADGATHTHTWGAWQSNASQHWRVCTGCGEENGRASHSGNPCTVCGYASVNYSIEGRWENLEQGYICTISGNGGVFTQWITPNPPSPHYVSAREKGLLNIGDPVFRNLTKTNDTTWSGQRKVVFYSGNTATSVGWENCTITMASNGQSFETRTPAADEQGRQLTFTRR